MRQDLKRTRNAQERFDRKNITLHEKSIDPAEYFGIAYKFRFIAPEYFNNVKIGSEQELLKTDLIGTI